jgi:hypothetical protein
LNYSDAELLQEAAAKRPNMIADSKSVRSNASEIRLRRDLPTVAAVIKLFVIVMGECRLGRRTQSLAYTSNGTLVLSCITLALAFRRLKVAKFQITAV